jgi:hypothetical protein
LSIENSYLLLLLLLLPKGSGNHLFVNKTADPIQNVQEAVLDKGEVCQLQLLHGNNEEIC